MFYGSTSEISGLGLGDKGRLCFKVRVLHVKCFRVLVSWLLFLFLAILAASLNTLCL